MTTMILLFDVPLQVLYADSRYLSIRSSINVQICKYIYMCIRIHAHIHYAYTYIFMYRSFFFYYKLLMVMTFVARILMIDSNGNRIFDYWPWYCKTTSGVMEIKNSTKIFIWFRCNDHSNISISNLGQYTKNVIWCERHHKWVSVAYLIGIFYCG